MVSIPPHGKKEEEEEAEFCMLFLLPNKIQKAM